MPSPLRWSLTNEERYEGDTAFEDAFCAGFKTDPPLTVTQWADRFRILSPGASKEPGPYRSSRAPYLKEIMDHLSPSHPATQIVFMKSAQVGATEAGNNWIGSIMHWSPAPVIIAWPTEPLARLMSMQRIEPMIADSPVLSNLVVSARDRDSGNTRLLKKFPGGILAMIGTNATTSLRGMPARYVFCDEIDEYPGDLKGQGDPVQVVGARTLTYGRSGKMFLVSTPTIHGMSRIERHYLMSDRRKYYIPCPHCNGMQWLQFERLKWTTGSPETVKYQCEHCEQLFEERYKTNFLAAGEWRPTAESQDGSVGFHISGLYSPLGWLSWAKIAQKWETSEDDIPGRKAVVNTYLGEAFHEDTESVDWERIYERREDWRPGTVPSPVSILTAAVDVQASPARLEYHVWGWGIGLESWAIDRVIIDGRADDPATWRKLEDQINETYSHPCGIEMKVELISIDTGDQTPACYAWIVQQDQTRILAIKGKAGYELNTPVGTPTNIEFGHKKRAIRLRSITGDVFKGELYAFLNLYRAEDGTFPPGFVHIPNFLDAEWCKQLVSERRVRTDTGKFKWEKLNHPRNEALDCRVYSRAALWTLGSAGWKPERWARERLKRSITDDEIVAKEVAEARLVPAPAPQPSRNEPKFAVDNWLGAERGNLRGDW